MSSRDPDPLIKAFLEQGLDELPDGSYDVVRASVDNTRQRVVLGPWRGLEPVISLRLALAIGALAALAVLAYIGAGASPSPLTRETPSAQPTPMPMPSTNSGNGTPLEPGTYVMGLAGLPGLPPMQLTVPTGWYTYEDFVFKGPNDSATGGVILELRQLVNEAYSDACHRAGNLRTFSTATELADLLAGQTDLGAAEPKTVSLGGTSAMRVDFSIPADLNLDACDVAPVQHHLLFLAEDYGAKYWAAPGDTLRFYVIDSDQPFAVIAHIHAGASANDIAELQRVIDSISFESQP